MKTFLIVFIILVTSALHSQPKQERVEIYNHSPNSNEYVKDSKIDNNGNIYTCGYTESPSGDKDFLLLKYNNSGVLLWARTYDTTDYDIAEQLRIDNEGNVYVLGIVDLIYYYALLKYDSSGNLIWKTIYDHPKPYVIMRGFAIDLDGNSFLSGTNNFINGDMMTVKFDSMGNLLWEKIFEGRVEGHEGGNDIKLLNNFIYVLGNSVKDTVGGIINRDLTIVKYDLNGIILDTIYCDEALYEGGVQLEFDSEENFVAAIIQNNDMTGRDIVTAKLDQSGNKSWYNVYDNDTARNESQIFKGIKLDNDDNVYLLCRATYQQFPLFPKSAYTLIKYSSKGDSLWTRKYKAVDNSNNDPESFELDSAGNIYVTGFTNYNQLHNRVATVKYSPLGKKLWDIIYFNIFTDNYGRKIMLDKNNSIFVAGESNAFGNGSDIVLIKYSETTSISGNSSSQPNEFSLHQNFPNPFNPSTNIKFSVPRNSNVRLRVFDQLGREVRVLVDEGLSAGTYEYEFTGEGLSSGVYFYKIEAGSFVETKKMLLIK